MPIYRYSAKKGPREKTGGKIEALSEADAVEKLSQMGCLPTHIEEDRQPVSSGGDISQKLPVRVKTRDITVFSRQMAILLRSGVPILKGIDIISEQAESPGMKKMLSSIYDMIKEGGTFSSALMQYPRIFSPMYVAMVKTGENSGALPDVLLRIADYRAKQNEMLSRFRMALAYPALMALVGTGTVIFMLTFVMPRLMKIFVSTGQDLPLPTVVLLFISNTLRRYWPAIIFILSVALLFIRRQAKTAAGRAFFSAFSLRLPLFGKFTLKAELARFSRTLELLVRSGIPILRAIEISIPVLSNKVIGDILWNSHKELEEGGSFGRSLKNSKLFPPLMTNLIIIGEESGRLDEALGEVANAYERDTDEAMQSMASLMEPLIILIVGSVVGFIVVAMLLPIFEINMMVK